ncbi:Spy/CpxP family protein refolding chaperone [Myxacorys almedinensis]|uniref:Uncharacterized protein n=1 Tax=Myxacorys almedinensis A TaxID=2690445 RepID=A0A8J8CJM8_9CYAN|nr:Spy/CpxP family protein refolding chaperone [Myxacorys almedinensis]NDJ15695.1 hypothetical protein [Myxacorys almedinensis A]
MIRRVSAIAALIAVVGGALTFRELAAQTVFRSASPTLAPPPNLAEAPIEPLFAQTEPGQPKKRSGMGWLKELNLSADQMQRIRAVREKYRDRIGTGRQAERQAQQELRSLMAGDASREQVQEKYRQVKALRSQVTDAQFESMVDMRDVLSLEQRQKFAERMRKQRDGLQERMQERVRG